jgi:uncharacterized iron-regulated membrane protein
MLAFVHVFVHHPQRLRLRGMLFQIHLWMGILLALYLALMGCTGAILVFEEELTSLSLHAAPGTQAPALPLEQVLHTIALRHPTQHVDFVSLPETNPYYRAWLTDSGGHQSSILLDALTLQPLPSHRIAWLKTVHDLHVNLALGPSGLILNGIGAACLLLLGMTGAVLWWPGLAHWTRGLRVAWRKGWRRINFDLHYAVGFWTLFFLACWGISGLYFAWPGQVTGVVQAISTIKAMRPPETIHPPHEAYHPAGIASLLAAAEKATPGGKISGIALPQSPAGDVVVNVDRGRPGDFSHRDIYTFSAANGQLLSTWHYGEKQTLGDWIVWLMYPLHFGTLWGLWAKILWALAALSLPVLSFSGLLMFWHRNRRKFFMRQ